MSYRDIVAVFGPAGSGKNTLINRVLPDLPNYRLTRSATTRSFRPSDDPGGTGFHSKYVYLSPAWFREVIALDGFLEYNDEYAGNAYGTLSPETTFCPLLEIDLVGVQKIKQLYPNARIVFITVPGATTHAKLRVLESRIIGRTENSGGVIDPNDLEKRLMRARQELDEGPALADVVITNLDPNEAASLLLTYIASVKL